MGLAYFGTGVSPINFSEKVANALSITWIALSVVSTVLSTLIITVRILKVSRMPGALESRRSYITIEIIVESAAIYATVGLIFLPFLITTSTDDQAIRAQYAGVFFDNTIV